MHISSKNMNNVSGDSVKRKSQSENPDRPVKRIQESEGGQSTSEKCRPMKRSQTSEDEQSISENCRPVKKSRKPENGQSTSETYERDDGSGGFSFSEGIIDESKAGIVERIYMRNFMCHSSMEVCLNPRTNFIVGKNGSGKSAILTALVVGLGGKASATSRGSSLKELIKRGMNTATIEITLRNTGRCSYKKSQYGDRIIVTRSISNATCGYKMKTEQGEVVSSKKEELDRILSAFNIQVDNPVSILNQDAARTFLNSTDPHDKYKLFMKATQLEQIEQLYKESISDKRWATSMVNCKKEALLVAKNEVTDLGRKWKIVQSLSSYRSKSRELENELYWAVAVSEEKAAENLKEEVESQRAEYSALQHDADREAKLEQKLNLLSKEVEQQINEVMSRLAECEAQYKGSREEVNRKKDNYGQKMQEIKNLQSRIGRMESNIKTLLQEIDKIKNNSGPDYEARRQKICLEIQELENRHADAQATLKTNKHHYFQLSASVQKLTSEEYTLKQELQENLRKIEQKQREIQALKRNTHNSQTVFGAWVPQVAQKIEESFRQRKFGKKPRGPIGAYIELKDTSWAPAIESFLGKFLESYCVDSLRDGAVLRKIFSEVLGKERKPVIITSRFFDKMHNVSKFAVQAEDCHSLLDSLIVSDVTVYNSLVDQHEVERILLIPTNRQACEIMSNARRVPRYCKRAITKKCDQFYPDPNYRMYSGYGNARAMYFHTSMQDAISTAEDHLKGYHIQKGEVEKQLSVVKEHLQTNSNELREADAIIQKLNKEDLSFMRKLTQLKDMEEPEPNSIPTFIAELEEHVRKKDEICKEHDALHAECLQLKGEMEKTEERSSKIRETVAAIQVKERPLLAKRESAQNELREILSRNTFREERRNELRQKILQLETELHKQQEAVEKAVEDATKICSRINTKRHPRVVERELNECKNYMESIEKHSGSYEEICVAYHEKKAKYEQITEDLRLLERELAHLEDMITARKKIFYAIQKLSSVRVQHMFQSLLYQRNYTGKIVIDHIEQTLEIRVSPFEKRGVVADIKSLSGGERSYSTVSFIMALWDVIDPPFYFLDEFDIFMDKVNRRVVLDLLLAHSQQKTSYQFVFLTPQDTSTIQSSADVTIHRMQDPCRGISNTQ